MGLVYPMVLSTLLMLGILGTIGYLFSLPASISKIVRTSAGEELELKIEACMRPSFWQYLGDQFTLAWRVGGTPRSTVNIRFQITVTGTNIANTATAYFYVEARDSSGSPTYRELNYTSGTTITVGSTTTFETGSMAIDTHLSHIYGSVPTADKTINYYLWCKVEATGLISGQKLTAEIPVQQFDSLLYDYGATATGKATIGYAAHVYKYSSSTNYGTSTYLFVGGSSSTYEYQTYIKWTATFPYTADSILSASLKLYCTTASPDTINVYTTSNFDEASITWSNKPALGTLLGSFTASSTGWVTFTSSDFVNYFKSCISNGYLNIYIALTAASFSQRAEFASDEYTDSTRYPYFEYTYANWSASWSWLNLDTLSISSLKVTQELAPLILVFVSAVCIILLMRRR
jgi:hypothetical protein